MITQQPPLTSHPSPRTFISVLLFAFIVRTVIVVAMPAGLSKDTDGYRQIAVTLRTAGALGFPKPDGEGLADHSHAAKPSAYRPPCYPLVLSLLVIGSDVAPAAIAALHVALGCATAFLVQWIGGRWELGRWSIVAAIGTTIDPILLHQSTQIMTETLATFIGAAALAALTVVFNATPKTEDSIADDSRHRSSTPMQIVRGLGVGLIFGVACLTRPTFLPWSGLVVVDMLFHRSARRRTANRAVALGIVLGMLITLVPWGLRNLREFGRFKITTTHGGYTLLLGNNPSFYRYLREAPRGAVWKSDELDAEWDARTKTDEIGDDRLAYRWARDAIRAEPLMFFWSCAVRVARFWHVLPHQVSDPESTTKRLLRFATAIWYVGVFVLCLMALMRHRFDLLNEPWRWGLLLCLVFTAVHAIYWSDMRMRAPLMPFIYLLAASSSIQARRAGRLGAE